MGFSKIFENGNETTHMLFWLKKHFQKCTAHGSRQKIDTFLEMYFTPEEGMGGFVCIFQKSKLSPDPTKLLLIMLARYLR